MLFRVTVVTLLLFALLISEWFNPDESAASFLTTLSRYILLVYAGTIGVALALSRTQNPHGLTVAQAIVDLFLTAGLVYLTGGADSSFVFLQLISIVGAAVVLRRWAPVLALFALLLYVVSSTLVWLGIVPRFAAVPPSTLAALIRTLATHAIAFIATALLSGRLARELGSARATLASQEVQLRDLEALHREIVSSLTSGLVTISPSGLLLTYNRAASEILEMDLTPHINQPFAAVFPALDELLVKMGTGPTPIRRVEVTHQGRVLGVSISLLAGERDDVIKGRVLNFADLTDLRRMEEIVARSTQLAAIGRLAAGVAHEIRNPLQAISGSIELLASTPELAADASARELTQIVLRESERLNALISELLDFARPREPQLVALDLGLAVREIVQVIQHDKSLDATAIELELGDPVMVNADSALLRQVLWNLLRNAAEASPGSAIVITLHEAKDEANAVLRLADAGPGIPADFRSRIFEPFFSTKERGTGLGLAIVHRILEQHRGSITAEAGADGSGTVMTIRLPLA